MGNVESIAVILFFLLATAAIVGVLVNALIAQRKREEGRVEGCKGRNWRYQGREGSRRWRIEGDFDGIPFEAEAHRQRSNNQTAGTNRGSTRLILPAEPVDHVVIAGPKLPAFLANMGFGGSIVQLALSFLLGDEAQDLKNVREVTHGEPEFQGVYTVISDDEALVEAVLAEDTQRALLAARKSSGDTFIVFRWRNRYEVRVQRAIEEFEDIERFIELGRELNA